MNFSFHDLAWVAATLLGALNAWQNKCIQTAILQLKLDVAERVAKNEGDLKELRALTIGSRHGD